MKKLKSTVSTWAVAVSVLLLAGCVCSNNRCIDSTPDADPARRVLIGWAKRSIGKEGPVPITGQFYLRVSQGVYALVIVQALAVSNREDAVIFVSADMVSVTNIVLQKTIANLKKEAPAIPAEKIILNSTHTHSGPSANVVPDDYPRQVKVTPSTEMQDFIARQITDAVKEAWEKRAPGSIAYGYGFATTGHSRRTVYLDDTGKRLGNSPGQAVNGRARMYGNTNDDMFEGYEAGTDAFINLLYTFDMRGKVTGAIINVPCPAQNNEHTWVMHGGFWNNVREKLYAKYGKNFGVIAQSAAAGDLAPRQMHYKQAEMRRYMLKYPELIRKFKEKPFLEPGGKTSSNEAEISEMMFGEDTANRIVAAFDEVLSWSKKERMAYPVIKHEVRTVQLSRRFLPEELVAQEKELHKTFMNQKYVENGDPWEQLRHNSVLRSRRSRVSGAISRFENQQKTPKLTTDIHVARIGGVAFASNRFELFLDYMHRIQARSPFIQTFIVQLVTDAYGVGSYLATERGVANKGYSATPYCNQVSPAGGQELVNETVRTLYSIAIDKANPAEVTVPATKGVPAEKEWEKAVVLENFSPATAMAEKLKSPTRVRLLQDKRNLYFRVECSVPDAQKAVFGMDANAPKRDGKCWEVDSVEFFFADGKNMYQFILAVDDCLMDAKHKTKEFIKWNCKDIKWSTVRGKDCWSGYICIPMSELDLDVNKLRFNIYRTANFSSGGQTVVERSCYLPVYGKPFASIGYFGSMKFAR